MGDSCQGSSNRAIVLIELFAGLLPLATAAKELGITIKASYSAEVSEDALTVARSAHSATVQLGDVQSITREVVQDLSRNMGKRSTFYQVAFLLWTPPTQRLMSQRPLGQATSST